MAFVRLHPSTGEDHATPKSQRLDERCIVTGDRGDPRQKHLAQQGHLFDGEHEIRFALELRSNLRDRPVIAIAEFPKTRHHIQSKGLATPSLGIFLVRTVDHSTLVTISATTFEAMTHDVDLLVSVNTPPLLTVALCQWLMTDRTFLHAWIPVQRLTVTVVPGSSHEVGAFCTP